MRAHGKAWLRASIGLLLICACGSPSPLEKELELAQQSMVSEDLAPGGVKGVVLGQMSRFPRHLLLPKALRRYSYNGGALRLPDGTLAWSASTLGTLLQLLEPAPKERALVVGVLDGWGAGLLAAAGLEVTLWDPDAERLALVKRALGRVNLDGYNAENIRAVSQWKEIQGAGPYECILVQGAVPQVPRDWKEMLAPKGGRLVAPEGLPGELHLLRTFRTGAEFADEKMTAGDFEPLYRGRPVNYARAFAPAQEEAAHAPEAPATGAR